LCSTNPSHFDDPAVKEKYNSFKGSYLYGSQVRGTFHKDSDIDVILMFDSNLSNNEALELAGIIGELDYKYDVFIDYHPYTLTDLQRNPFYYREVTDKGIYFAREAA